MKRPEVRSSVSFILRHGAKRSLEGRTARMQA
jgi:hypothetical protein